MPSHQEEVEQQEDHEKGAPRLALSAVFECHMDPCLAVRSCARSASTAKVSLTTLGSAKMRKD